MSAFRKWWQFIKKTYKINPVVRCLSVFFYFLSLFYQDPVSHLTAGLVSGWGCLTSQRKQSTLHTLNRQARNPPHTPSVIWGEKKELVCVPPVPLAHAGGAVSFVAHLQSLRAAEVHLTLTPVSSCTQSLVFSKGKNKAGSCKLKISTKVM